MTLESLPAYTSSFLTLPPAARFSFLWCLAPLITVPFHPDPWARRGLPRLDHSELCYTIDAGSAVLIGKLCRRQRHEDRQPPRAVRGSCRNYRATNIARQSRGRARRHSRNERTRDY